MIDQPDDFNLYLNNPEKLILLLNGVIDHLEAQIKNEDTSGKEAQLREISKAIERLEKVNIIVPDVLRAEKTKIAANLNEISIPILHLQYLQTEFDSLTKKINSLIGKKQNIKRSGIKRGIRNLEPKTKAKVLRELIIQALMKLGGSGRKKEIVNAIEIMYKGKFLPGDLIWRTGAREYAWKNNIAWERLNMIKAGILKTDSPTGVWELTGGYK
jgi:hypothetical protein